nr:fucolectin-like [Crassostrea gigas]
MDKNGIDTSDRLRNVTVTEGLTVFDVNTPCGVFAGPGTLSQLVVDMDCSSVLKGRFVKIAKTTVALTLFLPNIALGKPAAQSSTLDDYNAEYAVDGNRETDIYVDMCAFTGEGDRNPWWSVDLLAVYNITSVRILNIDDGDVLSLLLRDVTVTVGLTESDVNTPCGFFAGPGNASQLVVIDCRTLLQGRFVKISKTTQSLILCEVDVFGVPV